MSQDVPVRPGLRERKRIATHRRIADVAARLAGIHSVAGTTVEAIADAADVSRATFFRYYDSKETAIAEGFSQPWVEYLLAAIRSQPPELNPVDTLIATFAEMSQAFDGEARDLALQQARISQTSSALQAWLLASYVKDELLIADAIAPRFPALLPDDPRPRLVGALAMTAVRIGLEEWAAADGEPDLSLLFQRALAFVEIDVSGDDPVLPNAQRNLRTP
ncbi:MAG: TetR family transcriptional regulator [Nocardioides sp.]